ncbi:LOW QUALITY PROTEIN: Crinkler (CRN), partial [Phytophthora megakarya]
MINLLRAIIGGTGRAFKVKIDRDQLIGNLKKAIQKLRTITCKPIALQLFLAPTESGQWLTEDDVDTSKLKKLSSSWKLSRECLLGSDVPLGEEVIHVLVVVPGRIVALKNDLEWKEPQRFCESSGKDWAYQGSSKLVDVLRNPFSDHFNAWEKGCSGTGKSHMLDEIKGLLCVAALLNVPELKTRMENAYLFHVTFENDTPWVGSLLNPDFPVNDISYRMLYQLMKERENWQ